jgi:low temperature requirement protein LtrA
MFVIAGRADRRLTGVAARLSPPILTVAGLIVAAAFVDEHTRPWLWLAALSIDLGGPLVAGTRGWTLSPGHFAERHALIVIIALGESIAAIGVAASHEELTARVVTSALIGLAIAATMWWAYFDVVAIVAERKLRAQDAEAQARMARDSYSYLHFPLVAGVVLAAFGTKFAILQHDHHLGVAGALALLGGCGCFLLALSSIKWRNIGSPNLPRLWLGIALLVAVWPVSHVPAFDGIVVAAVSMVGLIGYESFRYRVARRRIRLTGEVL